MPSPTPSQHEEIAVEEDPHSSRSVLLEAAPGLGSDSPEADTVELPCRVSEESEGWNFVWMTLHQVLMRVGWIFKTESIVMPYFMDLLGGGPVLRGAMMVCNRAGLSVPPALYARSLKLMPYKHRSVMLTTLGMAVSFGLLALVWWSGVWRDGNGEVAPWMPYLFLAIYAVFFGLTGINQQGVHAIHGKLVRPERRGRLFAAGVLVGGPLAIGAAWWLMPGWLEMGPAGFTLLFLAPAAAFALASLMMFAVRESADSYEEPPQHAWNRFRDAARLVFEPGPYRGISMVALLYSTMFCLFPHYQALPREVLEAEGASSFDVKQLMLWTITQHAAVGALSLVAGPLADRFGNRLAVRLMVFGSMTAPLTAVLLSMLEAEQLARWFWIVFIPLGFTPVTIKVLINYTLELVDREEHPRYLSAIGLSMALPVMIGSPLVGLLVGVLGVVPVFAIGAGLLLFAGLQTLRLSEPRHA